MDGANVSPTPAILTHDTKGNITTDDRGCGLAWDFDNMLQSFAANGVTGLKDATYEYDAIGRRVGKAVVEASGTETTTFVQASQQVLCEYASRNPVSVCHRKFVYGSYIDESLTFIDASSPSEQSYYLLQDRRFSAYSVTTDSGDIAEFYLFDAHGLHQTVNTSGNPIGQEIIGQHNVSFTGRQYGSETGTLFMRSRWYSPGAGVFLQRDKFRYVNGANLNAAYFAFAGLDPLGTQYQVPNRPPGYGGGPVPNYTGPSNYRDAARARIEALRDALTQGNACLANAFGLPSFFEKMASAINDPNLGGVYTGYPNASLSPGGGWSNIYLIELLNTDIDWASIDGADIALLHETLHYYDYLNGIYLSGHLPSSYYSLYFAEGLAYAMEAHMELFESFARRMAKPDLYTCEEIQQSLSTIGNLPNPLAHRIYFTPYGILQLATSGPFERPIDRQDLERLKEHLGLSRNTLEVARCFTDRCPCLKIGKTPVTSFPNRPSSTNATY